jgi:hypothetical protein
MTKFYREPVKKIGMERRIVAMETQNPHCHPYGKLIKHVLVSSTLSFVKIFLNSLQKGNWDLSASRRQQPGKKKLQVRDMYSEKLGC